MAEIVDVLTQFCLETSDDERMQRQEPTGARSIYQGVVKIIQSDNESTFVKPESWRTVEGKVDGLQGQKRVLKYFPRQNGLVESRGGEEGNRIKLRLLVTETSRNRKKKENRGKIDSHQARLLQRKESRWNIYYDVSIKNPHPNSLISINRVFSHK